MATMGASIQCGGTNQTPPTSPISQDSDSDYCNSLPPKLAEFFPTDENDPAAKLMMEQVRRQREDPLVEQRNRLHFQPLTSTEAASIAQLGRSFVTPEDQAAQTRLDSHRIAKLRRDTQLEPSNKYHSGHLRPSLVENKGCIMNPYTSDLMVGKEGYTVEGEKGCKYRSVGSIYHEEHEAWMKTLMGATATATAEGEEQSHAREVGGQPEKDTREAREQQEKAVWEASGGKKLERIQKNMAFLLQDEPLGHDEFTRMHYQTDDNLKESDEIRKAKAKDPRYAKPLHTASEFMNNYLESAQHQDRMLKAEEKALNGVMGMEHIERGLTAEEKRHLFGENMDLDGMVHEMFLPTVPSEYQQQLNALDGSYKISLQKSADELEDGPHCTFCKEKGSFPHVDPSKSNNKQHSKPLPNLDYHYYPQSKVDKARYEDY